MEPLSGTFEILSGNVQPLCKTFVVSGTWNLLSVEPFFGTFGNLVPGFQPLPQTTPFSFIGRTPSFSSCRTFATLKSGCSMFIVSLIKTKTSPALRLPCRRPPITLLGHGVYWKAHGDMKPRPASGTRENWFDLEALNVVVIWIDT